MVASAIIIFAVICETSKSTFSSSLLSWQCAFDASKTPHRVKDIWKSPFCGNLPWQSIFDVWNSPRILNDAHLTNMRRAVAVYSHLSSENEDESMPTKSLHALKSLSFLKQSMKSDSFMIKSSALTIDQQRTLLQEMTRITQEWAQAM